MAKGYPAIHKESMDAIGIGYEEEADRWMGYYAYRDNLDYRVLIEELGPEKAYKIYEKIWQTMAEELLDGIMEAEGIKQISSTKDLEKISKHYWEAITCPYETEKTTETEHYGLLTACPYVELAAQVGQGRAGAVFHQLLREDSRKDEPGRKGGAGPGGQGRHGQVHLHRRREVPRTLVAGKGVVQPPFLFLCFEQ